MRAAERKAPTQPARLIAEIDAGIAELFRSCPALTGFTVQSGLRVTEVAVQAWPGDPGTEMLVEEQVADALAELAETHPEAPELLRNRTFARALH